MNRFGDSGKLNIGAGSVYKPHYIHWAVTMMLIFFIKMMIVVLVVVVVVVHNVMMMLMILADPPKTFSYQRSWSH